MTDVVYVVSEICDYEYGCREIRGIFSDFIAAQKYVESLDNCSIEFWDGNKKDKYIIQSYYVHGAGTGF